MKWIYTTCEDSEEAKGIARTLLKEKLVACVQVTPKVETLYVWKGEVHEEPEVMVFMKTTNEKADLVQSRIEELHSYDCPCVLKIDVESLNSECLEWLNSSLKS